MFADIHYVLKQLKTAAYSLDFLSNLSEGTGHSARVHSENRTYTKGTELVHLTLPRQASAFHCTSLLQSKSFTNPTLLAGDFNDSMKSSFKELYNFLSQGKNPSDFKADIRMRRKRNTGKKKKHRNQ